MRFGQPGAALPQCGPPLVCEPELLSAVVLLRESGSERLSRGPTQAHRGCWPPRRWQPGLAFRPLDQGFITWLSVLFFTTYAVVALRLGFRASYLSVE